MTARIEKHGDSYVFRFHNAYRKTIRLNDDGTADMIVFHKGVTRPWVRPFSSFKEALNEILHDDGRYITPAVIAQFRMEYGKFPLTKQRKKK
ncbi:hypothetical protein IT409_00855 [Candidatus Falkowbacteria bacterium]|nr:hypothetical protein [Candidatus Falkowbacteria bacterium]